MGTALTAPSRGSPEGEGTPTAGLGRLVGAVAMPAAAISGGLSAVAEGGGLRRCWPSLWRCRGGRCRDHPLTCNKSATRP
jgi:hypothetical protein